ncbi:MAG: DUF1698 domain-containing protein [Nitrospinae bacterium]|nr:DUF1698 domain-containing protein [Nitrospinota bacterium]
MTDPTPPADLSARAAAHAWMHTIALPGGVVTRGSINTIRHLPRFRLPDDLTGMTVLDVGACDGFYSFEAKRRGARRVVAVDRWGGASGTSRAGFDLAREALGLDVEALELDLYDLPKAGLGTFDLVFFFGVLYHVKDPWGAINAVASCAADRLILETHVDLLDLPRPAVAFYNSAELARTANNHCGPNPAAVEMMLADAGFTEIVPRSLFHYPDPAGSGVIELLEGNATAARLVADDLPAPEGTIANVRMVWSARRQKVDQPNQLPLSSVAEGLNQGEL